jgi:hypothetical protein
MIYFINSKLLVTADGEHVRSFQDSRALKRMTMTEQVSEVRKFCNFKFQQSVTVLEG